LGLFGTGSVDQDVATTRLASSLSSKDHRAQCAKLAEPPFPDGADVSLRSRYSAIVAEVLFDLVDSLYRQKHSLTVTGNYSMRELIERERMHPAIVRRLDDMCTVVEV
jgi:hypothetical protein